MRWHPAAYFLNIASSSLSIAYARNWPRALSQRQVPHQICLQPESVSRTQFFLSSRPSETLHNHCGLRNPIAPAYSLCSGQASFSPVIQLHLKDQSQLPLSFSLLLARVQTDWAILSGFYQTFAEILAQFQPTDLTKSEGVCNSRSIQCRCKLTTEIFLQPGGVTDRQNITNALQ